MPVDQWMPSERYPDPSIKSLDRRFDKYRVMLTHVERLATGMLWGEGPVWFGDGLCVPNIRFSMDAENRRDKLAA